MPAPSNAISLQSALSAPEHMLTQLWCQARDIMDTCPTDLLTHGEDGDHHYLISPSTRLQSDEGSDTSHRVAIAVSTGKNGKYNPKNAAFYLIADGNYMQPYLLGKHEYNMPLLRLTDMSEIDPAGISTALKDIKREIDSVIRRADQTKRDRTKKIRNWAIAVTIVGVIAAVPYVIYSVIHNAHVANDREYAAFVADYDARNVTLGGVRIAAGESHFVGNNPVATAERVPTLDTLGIHVRSTSISAGSCNSIGRIDPKDKVIAASDGPKENVMVQIDSEGKVTACAVPNTYATEKDSNGNVKNPSYELLLQVAK